MKSYVVVFVVVAIGNSSNVNVNVNVNVVVDVLNFVDEGALSIPKVACRP